MSRGAGSGAGGWVVERREGSAADLHGAWPEPADEAHPRVAVCRVTAAALVLGSTQARADDGLPPSGPGQLSVVRRRGGGGAVLVGPGAQVWVDVWVPRAHPRWDDDVVRAAWWVGEAWACSLRALGVPGTTVARGPSAPGARPDVCFGAVGAGEVTGGTPPRKVVGISQHRRRSGARLSSVAPVRWDPEGTVGALTDADVVVGAAAQQLVVAVGTAAWGLADLLPGVNPGQLTSLVEDAVVAELSAG